MSDAKKPPAKPDYATSPEVFRNPPEVHPVTLSPEDAAAVDRLLEHGFDAAGVPQDERTKRAAAWLDALAAHRVAQPPMDLATRTLAAVLEEARSERMRLDRASAPRSSGLTAGFSRRLVEYAAMAIAATVLIAVLIPGIGAARETAKRVACADNLRTVGAAFTGFAADHANALPMLACATGETWQSWKPVPPASATSTLHSNTANLLPLIRKKYLAEATRLACPATPAAIPAGWTPEYLDVPDALRGYAYTSMYGPVRPTWDRKATTIVLADRNPVFSTPACDSIHVNSPNHAGRGSMVLYADASARWQLSPDIGPGNDNIWTVATKTTPVAAAYTYKEFAASPADVFLAP